MRSFGENAGRPPIAQMRRLTRSWRSPHASVRRVAGLGCAAGAALLVVVGRTGPAAAEPDGSTDVVAGTGACPEPQAVLAALSALVVVDRVEQRLRALAGGAPPVEVTDLGAAFRVRAGDRTRDYEDDVRDCANRAKLAALFVALAADSADEPRVAKLPGPPPVAPPPVAATIHEPPAAAIPRSHVLYLEVGADARLDVGASALAPGALAQLAWERGRLSVAAGGRGSAPTQATIGGVGVRQWRVAAQLAARVRLLHDRAVLPFLELGAVVALLSERGTDAATARGGTAGEVGIVAGGGASFLRRTWGSAFVLVEAELDPAPPHISVLPAGDIGRTPRVWVGAAAGMSVGLF
jgi:hypothetical protein